MCWVRTHRSAGAAPSSCPPWRWSLSAAAFHTAGCWPETQSAGALGAAPLPSAFSSLRNSGLEHMELSEFNPMHAWVTGNLLERYKQSQDKELPEETSACTCTQNFVLNDIYVTSYQDSFLFLTTDHKREDAMIRTHQQCRGAEQINRENTGVSHQVWICPVSLQSRRNLPND